MKIIYVIIIATHFLFFLVFLFVFIHFFVRKLMDFEDNKVFLSCEEYSIVEINISSVQFKENSLISLYFNRKLKLFSCYFRFSFNNPSLFYFIVWAHSAGYPPKWSSNNPLMKCLKPVSQTELEMLSARNRLRRLRWD